MMEEMPDRFEKLILVGLLNRSIYEYGSDEYNRIIRAIFKCTDYKVYEKIHLGLEARQKPIDQIKNPGEKDIIRHINKIAR